MANSYNELFGLGSHAQDSALVAWLKLQETTGTTAADSSSNGNNGTFSGMGSNPVTGTGPTSWLPNAISFDGVDDFIDLGVLNQSGDDHTLLMFMKRPDDPPSVTSKTGFGKFGEGTGTGGASHYPYTNGQVFCSTFRALGSSSISRVSVGNPILPLDAWRQVCVKTTPGTNGWQFRLDGADVMTASGITSLYRGGSHWIGQSLDNLVSYWFNGHIAGYAQFQRKLSNAEESEAFAGPEPINLTAPTGSMSSGTFNGNVGTWDGQSNGTVSCAWELRNVTGDVVEASGTLASGEYITASGSYAGSYYLHVRASNDGGYDPAEDSVSTQFTSDGSTPIPVDTSDSLSLTDTAGINYIFTMSVSDSLSLSDMTENSVVRDEAIDTLSVSESVAVTGDHIINVTETLAITDLFELVVEGDASDTLAVTDDLSSAIAKNYRESATDTLSLSNAASAELDRIALTTTTSDNLAVSGLATCYVELSVSLEDELVTTETSVDPDTLDIVETETGLADAASAPGTVAGSASDKVNLSGTATAWVLSPGGIEESVSDTLTLDDSGQRSLTESWQAALTVADSAAGFIAQAASDELTMSDTASALLDGGVTVTETLAMSDKIASQLIERGCPLTQMYDTSQAGEYAAQSATTGFRLRYPATSFTSEVVLRPPNLGNKDRISLQRINRVSRGGQLFIYADPIWPKVETMALTFSALCREDAIALQDFMQLSLGDEIALFDWEDREWRGVITEVQDPIVEDRRNSYSASFMFEGTKV